MPKPTRTLYCSFCGKSQHEVRKLVAGPKVHICDSCVDSCMEILGEDQEWCDLELAHLKRLRKQARHRSPMQGQSEQAQSEAGRNWLGRIFRY